MTDLLLPRGSLRRFREQLGERYSDLYDYQFKESDRVIVVGDYSSDKYWDYEEKGIYPVPALMIFDGVTRRNDYSRVYQRTIKNHLPYIQVQNPAGSITSKAYECIDYCLKNNIRVLKVDGEEDLLTLAVIAQIDVTSVQDYYVVFGIPDEGVEIVRVNPEVQDHVIDLLNSMRRTDYTEHGEYIAVAGTFTYIHDGHRKLLRKAIELCEDDKTLSLGLSTNDLMYQTRYGGVDYILREKELREFFEEEGFTRYVIWPLHQVEVLMESGTRTLVCSTDSIEDAYRLNRFQGRCTTNGISDPPLEIVEVPIVPNSKGIKHIRIQEEDTMSIQVHLYKLPSGLFIVMYANDSGASWYALRQYGKDIANITEKEFYHLREIAEEIY